MRNKSFLKIALDTFIEYMVLLYTETAKSLHIIINIIYICLPSIYLYFGVNYKQMLLLSIISLFVYKYICTVDRRYNSRSLDGIPLPVKQFVEIDRNGFISFKEESKQEALQYMAELEQYLIKRGKLNIDKLRMQNLQK